jgi:hypothetical protein
MHKAYAQCADDCFGLGYLSQEERMSVCKAVGDGLDAFRDSLDRYLGEAADRETPENDVDHLVKKNAWLMPGVRILGEILRR